MTVYQAIMDKSYRSLVIEPDEALRIKNELKKVPLTELLKIGDDWGTSLYWQLCLILRQAYSDELDFKELENLLLRLAQLEKAQPNYLTQFPPEKTGKLVEVLLLLLMRTDYNESLTQIHHDLIVFSAAFMRKTPLYLELLTLVYALHEVPYDELLIENISLDIERKGLDKSELWSDVFSNEAWLELPSGTTLFSLLLKALAKQNFSVHLIDLIKKISQGIDTKVWLIAPYLEDTPLSGLVNQLLNHPDKTELISLVTDVAKKVPAVGWTIIIKLDGYEGAPSLFTLFKILANNPSNEAILALAKEVNNKLTSEEWRVVSSSYAWKANETLYHLTRALRDNPTNNTLIELVSTAADYADFKNWLSASSLGLSNFFHLTQTLNSHPSEEIIALVNKVLKKIDHLLWTPYKFSIGFEIFTKLMLALYNHSNNQGIIELVKIYSTDILWSKASEQRCVPLGLALKALANNPDNKDISTLVTTAGRYVTASDWVGSIGASLAELTTPLQVLTTALINHPRNEFFIKLVQQVATQLDSTIWLKTDSSGSYIGKSYLKKLFIALAKNVQHPVLITVVCFILNENNLFLEKNSPYRTLLFNLFTSNNLIYFYQHLINLKLSWAELAAIKPNLFTENYIRSLQILRKSSNLSAEEEGTIQIFQSFLDEIENWSFVVDETPTKHSKTKSVTLLSCLLELLENPTAVRSSQLRVLHLLEQSSHHHIESWKSLDGKRSAELVQLEILAQNCAIPELQERLGSLNRHIHEQVVLKSKPISAKLAPIASAKKSLWDLIEAVQGHPNMKHCTALTQYNPNTHWGNAELIVHPQCSNTWTPWMLFIHHVFKKERRYTQDEIRQLFATMNHLLKHLPESAWSTPLLMNEELLEYPMHALISILAALKSEKMGKCNKQKEVKLLTIQELQKFIEASVKHLYEKHPKVLYLAMGRLNVTAVELLFCHLPKLKDNNSLVIQKLLKDSKPILAEPTQTLSPQISNSIFAKKDKPVIQDVVRSSLKR